MGHWEEAAGKSDEWYTPAYIFDALGESFLLDVAAPPGGVPWVPSRYFITADSLSVEWRGFVWMNPPFGGRNGIAPWLDKFFEHPGGGIALSADRSSAPWWQAAARRATAVLFTAGKVRFIRPDGTLGSSPNAGTTLFASDGRAMQALLRAEHAGLGTVFVRP